jgi:WD40 repeat protein
LLANAKVRDGGWPWGGYPVVDERNGSWRAVSAWGKGDDVFEGDAVFVDALHEDGSHKSLGSIRLNVRPGKENQYCLDRKAGRWLALVEGSEVSVIGVGEDELFDRRLLGRHDGIDLECIADPLGRFFLTASRSGGIRKWDPSGELEPTDSRLPRGVRPFALSTDGSRLFAGADPDEGDPDFSIWSLDDSGLSLARRYDNRTPDMFDFDPIGMRLVMRGPLPAHRLWSLAAPAAAEPTVLRRGPSLYSHVPSFSPDGRWLATNDRIGLALWPLVQPFPAVIGVDFKPWSNGVAFGPDGRFLATSAGSEVRVWPLDGAVPASGYVVFNGTALRRVAVSPDGETFAAGSLWDEVWIGRRGEEPLELPSAEKMEFGTGNVSFSADGRLVAAIEGCSDIGKADFRVWDVTTGEEVAILHLDGEGLCVSPGFVSDGRLLTALTSGVVAWDIETGEREVLVDLRVQGAVASVDGRRLLVTEEGENEGLQDPAGSPIFFDLENGTSKQLVTHGLKVCSLALDQRGTFAVTGDSNGVVRVGPVTGEAPHLLLGHDTEILDVAIDPLGRWIASAAMDKTLRLWPMPDLSKPPLHTLPRDELIAKLKTLTNIRVVRDGESPTGWTLTHEPFPGWETVPTW